MNSAFNEQILADKLSKLNGTQQCIETLSHWCIFHREKAEQVAQTWDKQFHISQKEQKVPFLYLANDIIQNSRRKGNEFVTEFWKVLPAALKDVVEHGDDRAKNVVSRLVGIWEERRVFGSHGKGLKESMLGSNPLPELEFNRKRSRSVRILKRDSRAVKIKLSVGGTAEKFVSALHTVISERHNEDADLNKCQTAVHRVGKMDKDVEAACKKTEGDPHRATLATKLEEQETIIKECIEKLRSVEANRVALVSEIREALHEQESELESVRTQMQVAQAQLEEARNMRRRLNDEPPIPSTSSAPVQASSGGPAAEKARKTAADIAAEVADKLAASTHSQQIMTSVLSTFAAEAAKSAGLNPPTHPPAPQPGNPSDGVPKMENPPISVPQKGGFASVQPTAAHQHQAVLVHPPSLQTQAPQPQYSVYPAPQQQFVQPSGAVLIGVPYTYASLQQPLPPSVQVMSMARPAPPQPPPQQAMTIMQTPPPPPPPMTLQQAVPMALQQAPSYRPLQPPSLAYYQHRSQ